MTATNRSNALTPAETVSAARRLLETHGIDGFSMRKLAAELGVNPMTIYLRFENKDALLAAVARETLDHIELPDRTGTWEEQVVALATALRSHLLAARGTAAVLFRSAPDLPHAALRIADHGLHLMQAVGYEGADAVAAFRALFWQTIGFVLADDAMRSITPERTQAAFAASGEDALTTYRALRADFTAIDPDLVFDLATRRFAQGLAAAAPANRTRPR